MSGSGRRCARCGGDLRGAAGSGGRCECSFPAAPSAPVPSPCIGLCELDPETRICLGCSRTIDEIRLWPGLGAAERSEILRRLGGG